MSITTSLLETLLSPSTEQRRQAETYLQSLSLAERCSGFCHVLRVDSQVPPTLQHLAAVLLRRNILQITELALLQDCLTSLMMLFLHWTSSNGSKERTTIRSALGECLAQVVGSLALLTFSQECHDVPTVALEPVFSELRPLAGQGDLVSLKVLVRLAESAPVSFTQVASESIPRIISDALQRISVNPKVVELVTVLIELVVAAGVASVATRSSPFPLVHDNTDNNKIDPQSVASQLGITCFHHLQLLEYLRKLLLADSSSVADEDDQALQHLIYAAERVPSLLAGTAYCFAATMQTCFSIASQSKKSPLRVIRALNVLVALVQVSHVKLYFDLPQLDHFLRSILPPLLGFLGMSDTASCEEEEWASEPAQLSGDSADGFFVNALYAKDLLEGIVIQFPVQSVQFIQPELQRCLQPTNNIDFAQICAALQALQPCLQTISSSFKQHALSSFNSALYWLEATLPMDSLSFGVRVQYHSLLVLGLVCECYGYDENIINHATVTNPQRVWRVLLQASQSRHTKIAALVCDTVIIYCRSLPGTLNDVDKLLRPFLSDIVSALLSGPLSHDLDQNVGRIVVKIRAIEVLSCLAQVCAPFFFPFYPTIMPGLITYANMTVSGFGAYEQSQLKGAAIEAASTIGMSLVEEDEKEGLRLFLQDAHTLMRLAVNILQQTTSVNDEIVAGMPIRQLLSSCSNITSALKNKYDPYLQTVMPHLLQRAADLTGVDFLEADETAKPSNTLKQIESGDNGTESFTVAIPGRGLTNVSLNSSKIEDKIEAIRGIFQHAMSLRELFVPYVQSSINTLLESVRFHYSVEVRSISTLTLEAVYMTASDFDQSTDKRMLSTYFSLVIKAMTDQVIKVDDSSRNTTCMSARILSHILRSANSVQSCYKYALLRNFELKDSRALVQLCMKALISCIKNRQQLLQQLKSFSEFDEVKMDVPDEFKFDIECQEWNFKLSFEDELLSYLVDSIGYNIKLFKTDFLPIFEEVVAPTITPFMSTACNDVKTHLGAICLFDDCVEHCGAEAAAKYAPLLAAAVVHGVTNASNNEEEADYKRACIYGIAQIARYAPNHVLLPFSDLILPMLFAMSKESKTSGNAEIIEVATSALASLVLFDNAPLKSTSHLNVDQVVTIFLKNLPLQEDCDEAKVCSLGLCELVEKGVISAKNKYQELIRIIGETLALADVLSNEIHARFLQILVYLQKELPLDKQNQAMAQLSQEGQHEIQKMLQQQAITQAKFRLQAFMSACD